MKQADFFILCFLWRLRVFWEHFATNHHHCHHHHCFYNDRIRSRLSGD